MPTTNNLRIDGSVLVNFRLIQVANEPIPSVPWYVTRVFPILLVVNSCDGNTALG